MILDAMLYTVLDAVLDAVLDSVLDTMLGGKHMVDPHTGHPAMASYC